MWAIDRVGPAERTAVTKVVVRATAARFSQQNVDAEIHPGTAATHRTTATKIHAATSDMRVVTMADRTAQA
jgi:hypothetical protein